MDPWVESIRRLDQIIRSTIIIFAAVPLFYFISPLVTRYGIRFNKDGNALIYCLSFMLYRRLLFVSHVTSTLQMVRR